MQRITICKNHKSIICWRGCEPFLFTMLVQYIESFLHSQGPASAFQLGWSVLWLDLWWTSRISSSTQWLKSASGPWLQNKAKIITPPPPWCYCWNAVWFLPWQLRRPVIGVSGEEYFPILSGVDIQVLNTPEHMESWTVARKKPRLGFLSFLFSFFKFLQLNYANRRMIFHHHVKMIGQSHLLGEIWVRQDHFIYTYQSYLGHFMVIRVILFCCC